MSHMVDAIAWPNARCCGAGDPDIPDCQCGPAERPLRAWSEGWPMPAMTPVQREFCLAEIERIEGYSRADHEAESDADLAHTVLCAWVDYCRDKGLM